MVWGGVRLTVQWLFFHRLSRNQIRARNTAGRSVWMEVFRWWIFITTCLQLLLGPTLLALLDWSMILRAPVFQFRIKRNSTTDRTIYFKWRGNFHWKHFLNTSCFFASIVVIPVCLCVLIWLDLQMNNHLLSICQPEVISLHYFMIYLMGLCSNLVSTGPVFS